MIEQIKDYWLTFKGIILFFFFLRKSCYRSEKKVRSEQYKKMRKLLLICEIDIPYYKKKFNEIGFKVKRDFNSLADLDKLPLVTKEDVKKNPEQFINPKYKKDKALIFKTSGSTGTPMTELVSKNQWVFEQGVIWRHWSWAGYRFRDKMAIVRSYAPKDNLLIKHDSIRNFRYYSPFHLSEENIKIYIEDMVKEKVKFIRGYPSSVRPLADYVIKTKCEIPKLKGILTASEVLSDNDREKIEKAFKCRIFNHYGLAEGIIMMGDCENHMGLHNYDEYGYVELHDTDDCSIKKIIGTNLNNCAMPLIRYETGDLAEISNEKCSCRRSSMVVKNIIGRFNSVLILSDRTIPLTNFYTVLEYYTDIIGWQIIQENINTIELRIHGDISIDDRECINAEFIRRIPNNVCFKISLNIPFIQKNEGKRPPFVSFV
jgi:phenylacetate-CoA ligase